MTVAFDAVTVSDLWTSTSPDTQTHTPVGTPRAVAMCVVTMAGTGAGTDHITGASYGALSLTRVADSFAADASGESGTSCWYFHSGTDIPVGAQSCTVTQSATSDKIFVVYSLTAADDCEVVDTQLAEGDQANPGVTLDSGSRTAIRLLALFSGRLTSDGTVAAGLTEDANVANASNSRSARSARQTSPGTGATALSWTLASDDVALSGIAISEIVSGGGGGATVVRSLSSMGSLRSLVSL
jgi:hypothetical protein